MDAKKIRGDYKKGIDAINEIQNAIAQTKSMAEAAKLRAELLAEYQDQLIVIEREKTEILEELLGTVKETYDLLNKKFNG